MPAKAGTQGHQHLVCRPGPPHSRGRREREGGNHLSGSHHSV